MDTSIHPNCNAELVQSLPPRHTGTPTINQSGVQRPYHAEDSLVNVTVTANLLGRCELALPEVR